MNLCVRGCACEPPVRVTEMEVLGSYIILSEEVCFADKKRNFWTTALPLQLFSQANFHIQINE